MYTLIRTHTVQKNWLVGCFGFNGPPRQYFSLYLAVFQREKKYIKKCSNNPHPHLPLAQYVHALLFTRTAERPSTVSLPGTIAPPDLPTVRRINCISLYRFTMLTKFGNRLNESVSSIINTFSVRFSYMKQCVSIIVSALGS